MEVYCFLTAPMVVKNCLGMLTFLGTFLLITTWWLQCYTQHGEQAEVPNFVGMTYKEAIRSPKARPFRLAIADSVFIEDKAPGEVISQQPKSKSAVKEDRTIYLTVVKSNPDLVPLPPLAGNDDYTIYSRQCNRLNIKTRISAKVPDDRLEPNTILEVIYKRDTITHLLGSQYKIEMGTVLDFVVTDKADSNLMVPDLVCLSLKEAKFILLSSGFSIGNLVKSASVTDESSAWVWKQFPLPESPGAQDLTIDLYLTQELPSRCQ
jgi:beta-lactam-binding protein with PASTA domain